MTGFMQVKLILDELIGGREIRMHGPFWRGTTRDEFVAMSVFGLPLLSVGEPENSNLIRALRGLAPFGRDLDPPPQGARFARMPARMAPAGADQIALIEAWIADGCPDQPATRAAQRMAFAAIAPAEADDTVDMRYWREVDDFFLYKAIPKTQRHVGVVMGPGAGIWQDYVMGRAPLQTWLDYLGKPAVAASMAYLREHQIRILRSFYGSPLSQRDVFDSLWRFGANILPPDPNSSGSDRHTMNSSGDWFNWPAFLEWMLRVEGGVEDHLVLARAWHIGLIADGLVRVDRPQGDRIRITDFTANQPDLFAAASAMYAGMGAEALLADMVRRAVESGVVG